MRHQNIDKYTLGSERCAIHLMSVLQETGDTNLSRKVMRFMCEYMRIINALRSLEDNYVKEKAILLIRDERKREAHSMRSRGKESPRWVRELLATLVHARCTNFIREEIHKK